MMLAVGAGSRSEPNGCHPRRDFTLDWNLARRRGHQLAAAHASSRQNRSPGDAPPERAVGGHVGIGPPTERSRMSMTSGISWLSHLFGSWAVRPPRCRR